MTEPANGVKTWLARVRECIPLMLEIGDVVNKVGVPPILLGLGIAILLGWVDCPYCGIPEQITKHDLRVEEVIKIRQESDKKYLRLFEEIHSELVRVNRVQRIRICADIADRALQNLCLQ